MAIDRIKDFKKVWRYNNFIHIMFVDQYGRFRTFRDYLGEFRELTYNNIVTDYVLVLNEFDRAWVKEKVLHFKACNPDRFTRTPGRFDYGL
ncbi:MAG: hypothetical protein ACRDCE_00920 [Cetobacterium sp.]|uniref:hypothetical protein n=1 Tax=Cetobacterium sp. TaxID=2071632 RepID=UPI003EE704D1